MLKDAPEKLQPYIFHGVKLDFRGNREPTGTCPFCNHENKFHVAEATGQFHCKSGGCGVSGNIYDFIRNLHELSVEECTEEWFADLSIQRGISVDFLKAWGIVPSYLTGEVIVPAFNVKGKLTNLYHWLAKKDTNKKIMYSTPSLRHGIFGMFEWSNEKKNVAIAEGPWTGAALHQIFSGVTCKGDFLEGGAVQPMFKRENSLEASWNIIGVPGCMSFRDVWAELFVGMDVLIAFDNDYPAESNGKASSNGQVGAGWKGTLRTARFLHTAEHSPNRIYALKWGDKGYTDTLKKGYDLRDALVECGNDGETLIKAPRAACNALKSVSGYLTPLQKQDDTSDSNESNGESPKPRGKNGPQELVPAFCESFRAVVNEWRKAFKWTEQLDITLSVMMATCASTSMPGSAQIWCRILGAPGTGKSSFCEALSVSAKYVFPLSIQKGFHSGSKDKEGNTCSLIPHMDGKTVIIKDGDTLLNSANRDQSLAELRDIYDGTSRARYRNSNEGQNYTGLRITFILAGTKSLKRMNRSYLGDRFLDCVIYEKGDDLELEANILNRSARNALRQMKMDDESLDAINDERMINAMCVTAGYLHYLRENVEYLANEVSMSDERLDQCIALGELTSYMRARQDKELEEEDDEVELPTRLTAQYVRLAICIAVVLNRQEVDDEVMKRVKKVAFDTCRGLTFGIAMKLAKYPAGLEPKTLSAMLHKPTQKINAACRFLSGIGVVQREKKGKSGTWIIDAHVGELMQLFLK